MTLYEKLKDVAPIESIKESQPHNYLEVINILQNKSQILISLYEATTIYWVFYPLDVFDLTRYYDLFKE